MASLGDWRTWRATYTVLLDHKGGPRKPWFFYSSFSSISNTYRIPPSDSGIYVMYFYKVILTTCQNSLQPNPVRVHWEKRCLCVCLFFRFSFTRWSVMLMVGRWANLSGMWLTPWMLFMGPLCRYFCFRGGAFHFPLRHLTPTLQHARKDPCASKFIVSIAGELISPFLPHHPRHSHMGIDSWVDFIQTESSYGTVFRGLERFRSQVGERISCLNFPIERKKLAHMRKEVRASLPSRHCNFLCTRMAFPHGGLFRYMIFPGRYKIWNGSLGRADMWHDLVVRIDQLAFKNKRPVGYPFTSLN